MEIQGSQFVQQTAPMDLRNMGGRLCTTSLEGCQHSHHLQKKRPKRMWKLPRYISFFCRRQDLCSDPTEQNLKPHHPRGGERDTVRFSFKLQEKHRAGSTCVYCLCRLREGIRHRKVHNHDSLHTGIMVNVRNGREASDTFAIKKQCQAG